MPTSNERRALWFLALVALSGSAVRLARSRGASASPAADVGLARQLSRVDSARERRGVTRRAPGKQNERPDSSRRVGPVDLDRASAAEIEALPGIGPALAARIVAHRDSAGGFGSPDAFCAVKGIGPSLMNRLRDKVTFSGLTAALDACKVAPSRASKSHVTNRKKRR